MSVCKETCEAPGIPAYLHGTEREPSIISPTDRLYLWYKEKPGISEFLLQEFDCAAQSANSHELNPDGSPEDVLYDVVNGGKPANRRLACLAVEEILTASFPNTFSTVKDPVTKRQVPVNETYTWEVVHDPTGCMFPHCEIRAKCNGAFVTEVQSRSFRSKLRGEFSQLAARFREELAPINSRLNGSAEGAT